jgi:hypothetical protein
MTQGYMAGRYRLGGWNMASLEGTQSNVTETMAQKERRMFTRLPIRSGFIAVTLFVGLFLAGIVLPTNGFADDDEKEKKEKKDTLVCYKWSIFPDERFKLNVEEHSRLSERKEEKHFGHPRQIAFSVHGKEIGFCGARTMVAVTGTVVTAQPNSHTTGQTGAHMGLEVHASRGDGSFGGSDFCRSGEFDCTTSEVSPTPAVWQCESRNEFDVYHGASTLTKVVESDDPLCSFFEDGVDDSRAEAATPTPPAEPAGGLRQ